MRPVLDADHAELREVLTSLLAGDVDVTSREVARRHSSLKNASAFTRSPDRLKLIVAAQQRQQDARRLVAEPHEKKTQSLADKLQEKEARVVELERQVEALIASHSACVRAVISHGGMPALRRFWTDYKAIGDALATIGAIPGGAKVIELKPSSK